MARRTGLLGLAMFAVIAAQVGNAHAAAQCANEAFRTGFGSNLPDCRAYEQVTPGEKYGAVPAGIPDHTIAAETGPGITFFSPNASGVPSTGNGATGDYPTFLATRTAESWRTQSLLTPQEYGVKAQFLGITPDLRYDLVQALDTDYEHPGFGRGLYLIDTETEALTTIVPAPANEAEYAYAFDGASQDGSKIFFETPLALTPEARGSDNFYVWDRETGKIDLVGILPESEGGESPEYGSFGGAYTWYEGQELSSGGALAHNAVGAIHAISQSGDQAYFTAAETGQLYLRTGLNGPSPSTVHVSVPNAGTTDPFGPKPAAFQEATRDGSRAFFLSGAKLTQGANTGPEDQGRDLYRFESTAPAGERLIDLTATENSETPNGAEVQGLLGISASGSSGYLVARGVLADGAQPGRENLYRFEVVGGQSHLVFVASLLTKGEGPNSPADQTNWSPRTFNVGGESIYRGRTARVSADGNVLVFASQEPLTGYSNAGAGCANANGVTGSEYRCSEIFRYESANRTLTCLSCGPIGTEPLGAATFESRLAFSKGVQVPEEQSAVTFANNMSEDGNHVFFQTSQPLVPNDVNGSSGCPRVPKEIAPNPPDYECQDVYEWEAAGTPGGSCSSPEVNGGCLYLLSSGQSDRPSFFAGASVDSSDVYILTTSSLVPSDRDHAVDVYDAGVGRGIQSQQGFPNGPCLGEACLAAGVELPATPAFGSAEVEGPGNKLHTKHQKHKKHPKHKKVKKHRRPAGKRRPKKKTKSQRSRHESGNRKAANSGSSNHNDASRPSSLTHKGAR